MSFTYATRLLLLVTIIACENGLARDSKISILQPVDKQRIHMSESIEISYSAQVGTGKEGSSHFVSLLECR